MSLLDRVLLLPDPWDRRSLVAVAILPVVVTGVLCARDGDLHVLPLVLALVTSILLSLSVIRSMAGSRVSWLLLGGAALIVIPAATLSNSTWPGWVAATAPVLLVALWSAFGGVRFLQIFAGALAAGSMFFMTAALQGHAAVAGFPAALFAFLAAIAFIMRDLELRLGDRTDAENPVIFTFYRRTLALVSTLLFFFGVVSLWPWLGKLYGDRYLSILVLGVLAPLLFFWGRLRQPRSEHPQRALVRFNRVLPYLGVILLVAIALG